MLTVRIDKVDVSDWYSSEDRPQAPSIQVRLSRKYIEKNFWVACKDSHSSLQPGVLPAHGNLRLTAKRTRISDVRAAAILRDCGT